VEKFIILPWSQKCVYTIIIIIIVEIVQVKGFVSIEKENQNVKNVRGQLSVITIEQNINVFYVVKMISVSIKTIENFAVFVAISDIVNIII